ncbi:hypothetical protein [Cellulosimicrobium funkei]|uniref:hypothetical protein n=1 Tax=Cellulosimicrobium funkei TaxID=264251 RepID=UPI0037DC1DA6
MTALVALESGYAFQTLVAAVRLEHDGVDEHDVEPDAPEPGGDPGPMPTPTDDDLLHDASCLPGCTQHGGADIEEDQ